MVGRARRKPGDKIGRLTLLHTAKNNVNAYGWLCKCSCGNMHFVRSDSIKNTQSCGCLRVENGKSNKTHGLTNTKAYRAWQAMKKRCLQPKHPAYKNYGGRGITVCKEWMLFENFINDMGHPEDNCWLDRIDNNQGYFAKNCRWATSKQQANNRRNNVVIDGITLTEASESSSHSVQVLSWRIYKMGMSLQEAMQTPKLRKRRT